MRASVYVSGGFTEARPENDVAVPGGPTALVEHPAIGVRRCIGTATAMPGHVVRCVRVLLVADTPWNVWLASAASVLGRLVKYLGERDFRIAE